jgi:formylglycine-generating enzyme required for sulfatase activity
MGFKTFIKDLLRPGWKHPDPQKRLRAVERIKSETILMEVYEHDEDATVRATVASRLKDQTLLTGIAKNDNDYSVRKAAVEKLIDQTVLADVAINDESSDVRAAAVGNLTDQRALADYAANDQDGNVRMSAVSQLSGLSIVYVAPGSFQMGSDDEYDNGQPVHLVTLSRGYGLGKYPVTQKEYESVMGSNPSIFKDSNLPVHQVSWNDAVQFCQKLTARERSAGRLPSGYECRLPTEAEWEFAARGGTKSRGYKYSGSDNINSVAWYGENSVKTHEVGTKSENELGIHDMSGNVWEWCNDWYDDYSINSQTDPQGGATDTGLGRVWRGGGWRSGAWGCSSTNRNFNDGLGGEHYTEGFRVAIANSSL